MKNRTEITIHDLAEQLGISASTVSRALNNNSRISEKTRETVRLKALELGYRPNAVAVNLRSKKSNTIGVVVPRIDRHFFSSAISGIEDYAWTKGFSVIIVQSNDLFAKEISCVQTLYNNRVDGLIVSISMQTTDDKHFRLFIDRQIPFLFFDRVYPGIECDHIVVDDFNSGYKITKHLIDRGCKRIAHIAGPDQLEIYKHRKAGFLKALEEAGVKLVPEYVEEIGLTKEEGKKAFVRLMNLKNRPDGVFCGNDTTALSALEYCRENKIRVPEDVALVGFSDEPFSAVVTPSLSTVRQPGYQMGYEAALRIINRIEQGANQPPVSEMVLPTELIIRESSK